MNRKEYKRTQFKTSLALKKNTNWKINDIKEGIKKSNQEGSRPSKASKEASNIYQKKVVSSFELNDVYFTSEEKTKWNSKKKFFYLPSKWYPLSYSKY